MRNAPAQVSRLMILLIAGVYHREPFDDGSMPVIWTRFGLVVRSAYSRTAPQGSNAEIASDERVDPVQNCPFWAGTYKRSGILPPCKRSIFSVVVFPNVAP